jgi:glutathione S-transferase
MAPITIHHLGVSQSERIPWLCEELGVPYELKTYARSPLMAPAEYRALHPSGAAPVVDDPDAGVALAESCAIIEYIAHRRGGGGLFVRPDEPNYPDFLYWWHWADGTFQPAVLLRLFLRSARVSEDDGENPSARAAVERQDRALGQMEARLGASRWLAGDEFTAADLMVVFTLTTARRFLGYDLAAYPNILRFLAEVGKREAYRAAMARCEPGWDPALAMGAAPPKGFMS